MSRSRRAGLARYVQARRESRAGWTRRLRWCCRLKESSPSSAGGRWRRSWLGNCRIRLETIQVAIESADVNAAVEHCRRRIDVIADLEFRNLLPVVGRQQVNPSGLVAKHHAPIDDGRGPPDWSARLIFPNHFAFIRGPAIEITIARADINLPVRIDRAGPNADVLARMTEAPAFGDEIPNQFAVVCFVTTHDAIFSSGVDHAVRDGRRRI